MHAALKPFCGRPISGAMELLRALRSRLTYANLISSLALFVALGGSAYALSVPKNSIGPRELRRGAVTTAKVRNHSLKAMDFRRGQLPALAGVRDSDLDPPPTPGTVMRSVNLRLESGAKAFVLGTVRDVFLSCGAGPCSGQWGIYVDGRAVPATGMRLQAAGDASDGYTFYALYGVTKRLSRGRHKVELGLTIAGGPVSVGQLGAQLGALTLGR
jgi:hypothetical protein